MWSPQSSSNDISCNFTQTANSHLLKMIDALAAKGEMASEDIEIMKKLSTIKHKDVLRDTL